MCTWRRVVFFLNPKPLHIEYRLHGDMPPIPTHARSQAWLGSLTPACFPLLPAAPHGCGSQCWATCPLLASSAQTVSGPVWGLRKGTPVPLGPVLT